MAPLATKRRTRRCRRCGKERKWHVCAAQQPPPPVDIDRISDLPDELLHAIVSLLPTKDGARTAVLSRRWSSLWLSAAVDLDDGDLPLYRGQPYLEGLITRILSTRCGPVSRLRLSGFSYYISPTISSTIDTWFQSTVLDKLEELHFRYKFIFDAKDPLPLSGLRFSELRVASYGRCCLPEDLGGVKFPKLRELTLHELRNSESTLHAMISACPALRSLFLRDNNGFSRVRICSPTLVSLGISVRERNLVMEELIVADAPSMEKLLLFDTNGGPRNIHVMSAPKLEVIGCLSSDMRNVQLESTVFQKLVAISPIKSLHAVKTFSLRAGRSFKLDNLIDFLKCFPCLEKLYFMSSLWVEESGQMLNGGPSSLKCLRHLKEIVLIDYQGTSGGDVNFVKFFLLNASVLKMMEFQVPFGFSKKWKAKQKRILPKRNDWASQVAKLNFVPGSYLRHWDNEYPTYELLSYDNPFGCQS